MAKVKNYILDEIDEDDFSLLAVHSSCEAYRLAFLLNSKCQCRFAQTKKRKEGLLADYPFESYEWINPIKGIEIRLFSNRYLKFRDEVQKGGSLFDLPETKELYLVQDLKDVDYIIKIDSGIEDQVMIERMESIDQVSYRYLIDQSQLKIDLSLNLY
ncbi:MAG: IPExxxVDY family protein [Flavobacteriaceae bacterium]|jgi:hypothetical protein